MTEPTRTIKIYEKTHPKLKILAATTGETMMDLIDRLVTQQEIKTMQYEKLLSLTAGTRSNPVHAQIQFSGTLTPEVAIEAAKRAFGHTNGVTVKDPETATTYRLTNGKAKDITDLEEAVQAQTEQEWRNEQAAEHRKEFE